MEHIAPADLPSVIREQIRVLRSGGRLVHFIPFYDTPAPYLLDAHLCNASVDWWTEILSGFDRLAINQRAPAVDQWDYSKGILSRYFVLTKRL